VDEKEEKLGFVEKRDCCERNLMEKRENQFYLNL
jgi:hypothetical protein